MTESGEKDVKLHRFPSPSLLMGTLTSDYAMVMVISFLDNRCTITHIHRA